LRRVFGKPLRRYKPQFSHKPTYSPSLSIASWPKSIVLPLDRK
jgi:hypothetical protein